MVLLTDLYQPEHSLALLTDTERLLQVDLSCLSRDLNWARGIWENDVEGRNGKELLPMPMQLEEEEEFADLAKEIEELDIEEVSSIFCHPMIH